MFEENEKTSLGYTLQKESLKAKKNQCKGLSNLRSKKVLFGAVCNLQDSPYRILRVIILY